MATTSYSFTASAVSGPQLITVAEDGVASVRGGVATGIAFTDIEAVRLDFTPSRFDPARYRCDIVGSRGRSICVFSTSFLGVGRFEDQADAYREFVFALHRGLAQRSSELRFAAGVSKQRYAFNIGCLLVTLPALMLVLFAFGSSIGVPAAVHLLMIVVMLPLVWRWLRLNRPQAYTADAIPSAMLPAGSGRPMSVAAPQQQPAPAAPRRALPPGARCYVSEDFGPIAEPGDQSWLGAAGTSTHWADAERYAEEANARLDAGLIGPPLDPPPRGEQPLPRRP